ncbi:MAG: exodeoxyribonuclease VII large subunit [candidate division Zixibacteria bacterium]|nr:exodeoxyribonuclease VII large subunit [candidate division Zixibacteria bacterium]
MKEQSEQAYTVTAVNKMARYLLEESFPTVWVEGEISNYLHHGSGHRYFSLKDDESQLKCAMWRSHAAGLRFEPKDGLKVLAQGTLTIYERNGQYQLSVRRMIPAGMGELELAFRQLKEKLDKEGLFDPAHKQPLPQFPMRIGIVTSPTGAVIHDMIRVIKRRNPKLDIILWPAEVQGDIAPPQLVEGIDRLNEYGEVDLIIIGRGGGSLEDLWAFNDERVVRAVYRSHIPVISAVGHEVDLTLTDFAADYSAATPSMAAELAAWPVEEFFAELGRQVARMDRGMRGMVREGRSRLTAIVRSPAMLRPEGMLESRYQRLDNQVRLLHLLTIKRRDTFQQRAALPVSRLEALSPLAVLARGYSVTRTLPGREVVQSTGDVEPGQAIETIVLDGAIESTAKRILKK